MAASITATKLLIIADYMDAIDKQEGNKETEVQDFCRQLAAHIDNILFDVAAFDEQCKEEEYTETGEAWELLFSIVRRLH